MTPRACEACGTEFVPQGRRQKACSTRCAYARPSGKSPDELRAAERLRLQAKCRRRRAEKLSRASEPYTLAEIAKRDRNRCGLCGHRVPMQRKYPDPKSPSIDHVIPLADGGDDVKANVQLAHFVCNSRKGVWGRPQQLALVG
ncbi:HNH endonuclease [Amycolatopsis palatopharyngis]|uniref:HNH endonuclease n=1 Tax=Amycolatopsis palatopharyngis TaxID=187982 RepID=UPI000E2258B0|nr:HNH endonuclease signature motif containing protein [Amycolatopsis palatopharyngis]